MDLSNPSDWTLRYQNTISDSNLPNFLVPFSFNAQIIALHIYTSGDKPTWYTAGYVNQLVSTNLVSSTTVWSAFSQRTLLGGSILFLPNNFASYQLQFSFPYWFPDAYLSVWEYTGSVDDSPTGELARVVNDVASIINNVTTIAEQVNNLITIVNAIRVLLGG